MISYISKEPSEERWADSSKSVGLLNLRLRTCLSSEKFKEALEELKEHSNKKNE